MQSAQVEDRYVASATAIVRLLREPAAKSFLYPFKWATIAGRKGPHGTCEVLKNGFLWRISLPRRLRPLFVVLSAVFTPAPDESLSGRSSPARRVG